MKSIFSSISIVFIGFIFSVFFYLRQYKIQEKLVNLNFQSQATLQANAIQDDLEKYLKDNEVLAEFLSLTEPTSYEQFIQFTKKLLEKIPSIQAYEWIPRVRLIEKIEFENKSKIDYASFVIFPKNSTTNSIFKLLDTDIYPVYFVEPLQGNEKALGFNLASNDTRMQAINASILNGKTIATAKVSLIQEMDSQNGILIFSPVYKKNKIPKTEIERKIYLSGFALSVLRMGDAINAIIKKSPNSNLRIEIFDVTDHTDPQKLFATTSEITSRTDFDDFSINELSLVRAIYFGERKWLIKIKPSIYNFKISNDWTLWGDSFATLLLTIFLILFIFFRKRQRHTSIESEIKFRALFDLIPDGIVIFDNSNDVLYANKSSVTLLNFNSTSKLILDKIKIEDLIPSTYLNKLEFLNQNLIAIDQPQSLSDALLILPNGDQLFVDLTFSKIYFSNKYCRLLVIHDVSERIKIKGRIQYLALHDNLTGLPNHQLLLNNLNTLQKDIKFINLYSALIFIDLDNFKVINDIYGHIEGDLLLKEVAKRLSFNCRENDTVARMGGDEFIILLRGLNCEYNDAESLANSISLKLLNLISDEYLINNLKHIITASAGIVIFKGQDKTPTLLLSEADMSMYCAKRDGKNRICFFNDSIRSKNEKDNQLTKDLRNGISQNQFLLYFQPQIDRDFKIIGAEALLRWDHPINGILKPEEFMGFVENSNFIFPLGWYIIDQTLSELSSWKMNEFTKDLCLSINLSLRQFEQHDFVTILNQRIKHYQVDPTKITLELTESQPSLNLHNLIFEFNQLKELGIKLSLDDLGTGYSSLSYLFKLPIHQVKTDRSFILNLFKDEKSQIILKSLIGLAKSLNLILVVEGIETEEQKDWLFKYGCDIFQGHFFWPALSREDFINAIS